MASSKLFVSLSYAITRLSYRRRVCLSRAGNASKLMNVGSCDFQRRVMQGH